MSPFDKHFISDRANSMVDHGWTIPSFVAGVGNFAEFIKHYGGQSFNQGLYRIHSGPSMQHWTSLVTETFPKFRGRAFCFSYDWLGRHFALDLTRQEAGQLLVLMFEPGTGHVLEIPASFDGFHNSELVEFQNEALASDFYSSWLDSTGTCPKPNECIGYKVPLFLGGKDTVDNLELTDMEVYWSLCGQMLQKTQDLPPGTPIKGVAIN